jgi:hypothetical protein
MKLHWAVLLVLSICRSIPAMAQSNCNSFLYAPNGTNSIGVRCAQNVLNCSNAVSAAAGMWNGCEESGSGFPEIFGNATGALSLSVEIRDMNSDITGGGCGFIDPELDGSNRVTGGHIVIFARRSDGSSCAPFDKTIAHEIGHALGFDDSMCNDGRMMGAHVAQGDYREVKPDECAAADDRWDDAGSGGGGGDGGGDQDDWCGSFPEQCGCPLIIDLNGDGIQTTDLSEPVFFDLDADGNAEHISWTNPKTEEAFVWVDLVPNGRVDNGAELFGIGTILPSGERAPNGFAALAVYDTPAAGGDADGRITISDAIWARLRVWVDANHDGISQPAEVGPIQRYGVVELQLGYSVDWSIDPSGNRHLLRGTCVRKLPGHTFEVRALEDVFFRRAP